MKHLFIDTNILLSFLHFTSDDLEEMRKLSALIRSGGEIKLLLPDQVKDEFRRNREIKLADSLQRLRQQRLDLQFPQVCKAYDQYGELRKTQKEFERLHSELLANLGTDIAANSLKADQVIQELFDLATRLPRTAEIVAAARLRREIGNPPGKGESAGDAINWESVLAHVPGGEDLYFVTADSDYCSPLERLRFNEFLLEEWTAVNSGKLHYYRELSGFFRENFPTIQLADEVEKDFLVQRLLKSDSFSETHGIVSKLSQHTEFTPSQASLIAEAATSNSQVAWIAGDADVRALLRRIVTQYGSSIEAKPLKKLKDFLGLSEAAEGGDPPS